MLVISNIINDAVPELSLRTSKGTQLGKSVLVLSILHSVILIFLASFSSFSSILFFVQLVNKI